MSYVQVIPDVILSNVTSPNNLFLNSYFENLTIGLHALSLSLSLSLSLYIYIYIYRFVNVLFCKI